MVSVGRANDTLTKRAAAILYFRMPEMEDSLVWLKGSFDCRLYTIIAETDSTFISGGFIKYDSTGNSKAFLSRWHINGRLIDSASHYLDSSSGNLIMAFQKNKEGVIYALAKSGNEDSGFSWLLEVDKNLGLSHISQIPFPVSFAGISSAFLYDDRYDQFLYSFVSEGRTLITKFSLKGQLLDSASIWTTTGYYNPLDSSREFKLEYTISPHNLAILNGNIILNGNAGNNIWVGKISPALKLLRSNQLYSPYSEEGYNILITKNSLFNLLNSNFNLFFCMNLS